MKPTCAAAILSTCSLAWLCLNTAAVAADPQATATKTPRPVKTVQSARAPVAKTFATPQQAADALVKAAGTNSTLARSRSCSARSSDVVLSGEYCAGSAACQPISWRWRVRRTASPSTRRMAAALSCWSATTNWPFPIPIVKRGRRWSFDTAAGRQELLYRRIGANELDAIAICRGYVEAQHEYALKKRDGFDVNQYAQRIISTPGKQDGLAWQNADGTWTARRRKGRARH